jgi:hypothetical protein
MRYFIIAVFLIMLSGCYVPHPANNVGVEAPRVLHRQTCVQLSDATWRCEHVRIYTR